MSMTFPEIPGPEPEPEPTPGPTPAAPAHKRFVIVNGDYDQVERTQYDVSQAAAATAAGVPEAQAIENESIPEHRLAVRKVNDEPELYEAPAPTPPAPWEIEPLASILARLQSGAATTREAVYFGAELGRYAGRAPISLAETDREKRLAELRPKIAGGTATQAERDEALALLIGPTPE